MRAVIGLIASVALGVGAQQPFSVKDVMSAPYALGLTAAPVGARFAWVENAEGVRNIWVAGPKEAARQITQYTEDDGQDIAGLAWSPDGAEIAYALGAENGAGGKPANPAELQRNTAVAVWVASVAGGVPVKVGEGRAPVFLGDGRLLFVRGGQIWVSDAKGQRKDATDAKERNGDGAAQLVFDRGSASGLTMSPDGKLLAYVSRRRGHSFIGLYEFATRTLRFVSPLTGNDSAPSFSPDGKQLAWLREPFTEAKEFEANRVSANPWSVQVASLDDLKARTVYQPEAGKIGSVVPRFATGSPRVWWAAGGRLLFCSEVDGWVHLYAVAPGEKAVLLTPGAGEVEDVSLSRDGTTVYWAANTVGMMGYAGPTDAFPSAIVNHNADVDRRHLWRADVANPANPLRLSLTSGEDIETRPVPLADGLLVAMASSARVPMHPVWVDKDGVQRDVKDEWLPKAYPKASLVMPEQVVFPSKLVAGEGKRSRLARYPTLSPKARTDGPPASVAVLVIHGQVFLPPGDRRSFQEDNKKSTVNSKNNNQAGPARASSYELRALSKGNSNSNGNSAESGKRPAIVFFHGGPRRQMLLGYPAMDYYSNAYAMNQYLASQGYLVLSVNYRCGIGYGLEFRQCEHAGADGASEYNDALAAVAYLRSRGDVDMKRVGIWGGSYGGYFTALGLARNSDLFAAGVDYHGVHDWTKEDNAPTDWLKGSNAEVDAIAERAVASSPIADVDKWRSPVLLIHGDDDPEVAYNQTPLLADALRARGVHVEELIFPDEVHGFILHRDWVKAYEAEADFFARQLRSRP